MHAISTKAFQLCVCCSCVAVVLHIDYFSILELFVVAAALAASWPVVSNWSEYAYAKPERSKHSASSTEPTELNSNLVVARVRSGEN